MRTALVSILALVLASVASAQEEVQLHYDSLPHDEDVAAEQSLGITIEGTDVLANFVRSMHPLLSLNSFHMKAEGTHKAIGKKKHKVQFDDARIAVRYDDEDSDYDWKRAEPPEDLASNKLEGFIWIIAMSPRSYALSAKGEYKSDDPNQDANGEALDIFLNAVTRLKDGPVTEGDTWTAEWKGSRSEKGKNGKWAFTQVVKVEKIGEKDGRRLATLTSDVTGTLEREADPSADENWTKCAGKTRLVLEVATGWIHELWGAGTVTTYYRKTGDDGSKQDVTIKLSAEGKRVIRK